LAARRLQARRQSFRVREHVVRDRDGCFHTKSITIGPSCFKACGSAAVSNAQPRVGRLGWTL
jgi:hypothetical protein